MMRMTAIGVQQIVQRAKVMMIGAVAHMRINAIWVKVIVTCGTIAQIASALRV